MAGTLTRSSIVRQIATVMSSNALCSRMKWRTNVKDLYYLLLRELGIIVDQPSSVGSAGCNICDRFRDPPMIVTERFICLIRRY